MVRWVFFDVGNVLLDEDPLTYRNVRRHVEAIRRVRPGRTFLGLLAEREARAAAGSRWPLYEVTSTYLDDATCAAVWDAAAREIRAEFAALSPPVAGAAALVDRLASHYRLGLIANQGAECREWLRALGWLERFRVVAFGEERGVFKPDPALFRHALEEAGVEPGQALMVGDRLDNDVAPAASLGMKTAWVRWPDRAAKGWPGDAEPEALAYLAALERASARAEASPGCVEPTIVVDAIADLDVALRDLPIHTTENQARSSP
jgi:HAD superfamily hydrolase (TIGR01549 family)